MAETLSKTAPDHEQWTEIITPDHHWFQLKLRELWRYRDLILLFVRRDFLAAHKQTVLGGLWHIITPFINTVLYTVVFNQIAGLTTEGVPPILFQAISYTIWGYFISCFSTASGTLLGNAALFSKVYFPRMSVAVAGSLSALLRLGIQLLVVLMLWAWFVVKGNAPVPTSYLAFVPLILLIMTVGGLGAGAIVSALTVKYRDLNMFVGYGVAALMYGSAVLYPLAQVPASLKPYTAYNPLIPLMEATRFGFFGIGSWQWEAIGISAAIAVVVFLIGLAAFHRAERTFIDSV
jgi:lipopolysaccharide transport system permease protein